MERDFCAICAIFRLHVDVDVLQYIRFYSLKYYYNPFSHNVIIFDSMLHVRLSRYSLFDQDVYIERARCCYKNMTRLKKNCNYTALDSQGFSFVRKFNDMQKSWVFFDKVYAASNGEKI